MTKIELVATLFNRSVNQVKFLHNLCGGDFELYMKVEILIKNNHIMYCPGNIEELNKILELESTNHKKWFNI